jgi:predicted kinase
MIIQLRGTSGSGKTTIVRTIMEGYQNSNPVCLEIAGKVRKRPAGYLLDNGPGSKHLFVVGHYETACGGCDTLPDYDTCIQLVRDAHANGHDVLFEGLLISGETRRCAELHNDGLPYTVVCLNTPLQECLDSVNTRRRAKKPDAEDVNPKNTEAKFKIVQRAAEKLAEAGVPVEWHSRDTALSRVRGLLA